MKELEKAYNPKNVEEKWYRHWEEKNLFAFDPDPKKKPFCIVIPPPNITGVLHMGHALNNTIQDLLIRWKRMCGYSALWQPGTDHAGIATQNVVERELYNSEKKRRQEIGRSDLIKRIWKWKEKYGSRIIYQLKKLGCSCDWSRLRFTLDEGLSRAVAENFIRLYKQGLIYKGKYIINWCPRCLTALADDEVDHTDEKGNLWYIRYPIVSKAHDSRAAKTFVIVATTRPETLLGDSAVAVNPKDERYVHIIGKMVKLPETDREIPIIADDFVDMTFGTGAVKVTPAHDPNDFQIGLRHNLPQINVMNDDATMNEAAGEKYNKLSTKEARKKIVEELKKADLIEKIEDHQHNVGHCYRCTTTIEPWLSDQWFVKMRPLAQKAIEASEKGKVKFHPSRWSDFYLQWLENVRDWCISRQIWWGHRIPVWYCDNNDCPPIVSSTTPDRCPNCNSQNLRQDEDVLDTWFSSALWPFSTLGWPDQTEELKRFYPTSVLSTDRGIIYFWVARMVMMGLQNMKDVPFHDVYIHGTILDEQGKRMSKSAGNGIDPLDIIEQFGTDALRFSLLVLSSEGQDLKLSVSKFEMGRNFCNKLWNASRFTLLNLKDYSATDIKDVDLSIADKWIQNRLSHTINDVNDALEDFKFNDAAQSLYHFVWNEFCDWYLESVKSALNSEGKGKAAAQHTLLKTLSTTLKLLHPFLPFITEELWHHMPNTKCEDIITAPYPEKEKGCDFESEAIAYEKYIKETIIAIRNIRGEHDVPPSKMISASLLPNEGADIKMIETLNDYIIKLGRLSAFEIIDKLPAEKSIKTPVSFGTIIIPFAGLIDVEAERTRLEKEIKKAEDEKSAIERKLSNANFVERAPKEIVAKENERLAAAVERMKKLKESLGQL